MEQQLSVANFKISEGIYYLQGSFDKFTIPVIWDQLQSTLKTNPAVMIDLSQVEECDSALIALLVEIKKQQHSIRISKIPDNLIQLLELYQVKSLLS